MDILGSNSAYRQRDHIKKRLVRCVDTGKVYASSRDAAEILATQGVLVTPEAISTVCREKQRSSGGLRWEYVSEVPSGFASHCPSAGSE